MAPDRPSFWSRPLAAALFAAAALVLASAAALAVFRAHADRMGLRTGPAEWIWYSRRVVRPLPLRFFATRDFLLPEAPRRATAKLFVDREHVLYVNGARAGGGTQRPGDPLTLYDVAPLLRAGANRVAIEAASPTGVGGILFSMDVNLYGRDALVSNGFWRVDLDPASIGSGARSRPRVWGRPPQYPWGYPRMPEPRELRGN